MVSPKKFPLGEGKIGPGAIKNQIVAASEDHHLSEDILKRVLDSDKECEIKECEISSTEEEFKESDRA